MNNGWDNEILIQVWDQTQIVPRKSQTSSDNSRSFPTKGRLSNDCDMIQHRSRLGHTHWVSDWSETSPDFLGLITDFLRQLWLIFVFSFGWWVGDESGIKPGPPGTKTKPTWH